MAKQKIVQIGSDENLHGGNLSESKFFRHEKTDTEIGVTRQWRNDGNGSAYHGYARGEKTGYVSTIGNSFIGFLEWIANLLVTLEK